MIVASQYRVERQVRGVQPQFLAALRSPPPQGSSVVQNTNGFLDSSKHHTDWNHDDLHPKTKRSDFVDITHVPRLVLLSQGSSQFNRTHETWTGWCKKTAIRSARKTPTETKSLAWMRVDPRPMMIVGVKVVNNDHPSSDSVTRPCACPAPRAFPVRHPCRGGPSERCYQHAQSESARQTTKVEAPLGFQKDQKCDRHDHREDTFD